MSTPPAKIAKRSRSPADKSPPEAPPRSNPRLDKDGSAHTLVNPPTPSTSKLKLPPPSTQTTPSTPSTSKLKPPVPSPSSSASPLAGKKKGKSPLTNPPTTAADVAKLGEGSGSALKMKGKGRGSASALKVGEGTESGRMLKGMGSAKATSSAKKIDSVPPTSSSSSLRLLGKRQVEEGVKDVEPEDGNNGEGSSAGRMRGATAEPTKAEKIAAAQKNWMEYDDDYDMKRRADPGSVLDLHFDTSLRFIPDDERPGPFIIHQRIEIGQQDSAIGIYVGLVAIPIGPEEDEVVVDSGAGDAGCGGGAAELGDGAGQGVEGVGGGGSGVGVEQGVGGAGVEEPGAGAGSSSSADPPAANPSSAPPPTHTTTTTSNPESAHADWKPGMWAKTSWDRMRFAPVKGARPVILKLMRVKDKRQSRLDHEHLWTLEMAMQGDVKAEETGDGEMNHIVVRPLFKGVGRLRRPGGAWEAGWKVVGYDMHLPIPKAIALKPDSEVYRAAIVKAVLVCLTKIQKIERVHQDIKPDNLVVELDWDSETSTFKATGRVLAIDCGDARPEDKDLQTEQFAGTLPKMPMNIAAHWVLQWLNLNQKHLTWNEDYQLTAEDDELDRDRFLYHRTHFRDVATFKAEYWTDLWAVCILMIDILAPEFQLPLKTFAEIFGRLYVGLNVEHMKEVDFVDLKVELSDNYCQLYDHEAFIQYLLNIGWDFIDVFRLGLRRPPGSAGLLAAHPPKNAPPSKPTALQDLVSALPDYGMIEINQSLQDFIGIEVPPEREPFEIVAGGREPGWLEYPATRAFVCRNPFDGRMIRTYPAYLTKGVAFSFEMKFARLDQINIDAHTANICRVGDEEHECGQVFASVDKLKQHLQELERPRKTVEPRRCADSVARSEVGGFIRQNG